MPAASVSDVPLSVKKRTTAGGAPPPSEAILAAVRSVYSANLQPPTSFPLLDKTYSVVVRTNPGQASTKAPTQQQQLPPREEGGTTTKAPPPLASPKNDKIDIMGVLPQLTVCFEGLSVAAKKNNKHHKAAQDAAAANVRPSMGATESLEYGSSSANLCNTTSATVLVDEATGRRTINYQQLRRSGGGGGDTGSNNNSGLGQTSSPQTPTSTRPGIGSSTPLTSFPTTSTTVSSSLGYNNNNHDDVDGSGDLLLSNVTGIMYGGRLTSVVSACGGNANSVLLGVVSGRMARFGMGAVPTSGRMDGSVWANNVPFALPAYTLGAVIIDDDSTSFEDLTVKQNLRLSLMLRKKRHNSKYKDHGGSATSAALSPGAAGGFTNLDEGDSKTRRGSMTAVSVFQSLTSDSQDEEFLEHMLDLLELRVNQRVQLKKCSQFVRRKVLVVQEILLRPFLMLLDSVTSNLPAHEAKILLRMLKRLLHDPYLSLDTTVVRKGMGRGDAVPMSYGSSEYLSAAVVYPDGELLPVYIPSVLENENSSSGDPQLSKDPNVPPRSPHLAGHLHQQRDLFDAAAATESIVTTCNKPALVVGMNQPRWAYLSIVDDVILMEKNRVVFEGTSEELLQAAYELYFKYKSSSGGSLVTSNAKVGRRKSISTAAMSSLGSEDAPSPEVVINFLYNVASDPDTPEHDSLLVQLAHRGHLRKTAEFINKQIMEFVQGNVGTETGSTVGELCGISFTPADIVVEESANICDRSHNQHHDEGFDILENHNRIRGRARITDRHLKSLANLKRGSESNVLSRFKSEDKPHPAKRLWFMLTYASWYSLRNEWKFLLTVIVLLLGCGWSLAAVYKGQDGQSGMQNRVGIIFSVISGTFLQAVIGVERLRMEINSFRWHRINGYFGPLVYLIYWFTTCTLIRFFFVGGFSMLTFGLANISDSKIDFSQIQELQVFFGLSSVTCAVLSFLATTATPSTTITYFVMFMSYALSVLGAGLILSLRSFPEIVRAISRVSIIRLGYESSLLSQFGGQDFNCHRTTFQPSPITTSTTTTTTTTTTTAVPSDVVFAGEDFGNTTMVPVYPYLPVACYTGDEYLSFLGFSQENKWTNMTILGSITSVLLVLSYVALQTFRRPTTTRN